MPLDNAVLTALLKNTEVSTQLIGKVDHQNDKIDQLVKILSNGMSSQLATVSEFVSQYSETMKRRATQEQSGRKPRSRWRDSIAMRITIILLGSGFGLSLLTNVAITIWETFKQHAGIAGVIQ